MTRPNPTPRDDTPLTTEEAADDIRANAAKITTPEAQEKGPGV